MLFYRAFLISRTKNIVSIVLEIKTGINLYLLFYRENSKKVYLKKKSD